MSETQSDVIAFSLILRHQNSSLLIALSHRKTYSWKTIQILVQKKSGKQLFYQMLL